MSEAEQKLPTVNKQQMVECETHYTTSKPKSFATLNGNFFSILEKKITYHDLYERIKSFLGKEFGEYQGFIRRLSKIKCKRGNYKYLMELYYIFHVAQISPSVLWDNTSDDYKELIEKNEKLEGEIKALRKKNDKNDKNDPDAEKLWKKMSIYQNILISCQYYFYNNYNMAFDHFFNKISLPNLKVIALGEDKKEFRNIENILELFIDNPMFKYTNGYTSFTNPNINHYELFIKSKLLILAYLAMVFLEIYKIAEKNTFVKSTQKNEKDPNMNFKYMWNITYHNVKKKDVSQKISAIKGSLSKIFEINNLNIMICQIRNDHQCFYINEVNKVIKDILSLCEMMFNNILNFVVPDEHIGLKRFLNKTLKYESRFNLNINETFTQQLENVLQYTNSLCFVDPFPIPMFGSMLNADSRESIHHENHRDSLTMYKCSVDEKPIIDNNSTKQIQNNNIHNCTARQIQSETPITTEKKEYSNGILPGKFTVNSDGKQIRFSIGNLQAEIDKNGKPVKWKFAENQYDCLEYEKPFVFGKAGNKDLFMWSTDGDGKFVDWGNNSIQKGASTVWHTPSVDEWKYLIEKRKNASRLYKLGVTVCNKKNCFIIAPDDFNGDISNSYDNASWESAESCGLVCLPLAGLNVGNTIFSNLGSYWIVPVEDSNTAERVSFTSKTIDYNKENRRCGASVRLITDIK